MVDPGASTNGTNLDLDRLQLQEQGQTFNSDITTMSHSSEAIRFDTITLSKKCKLLQVDQNIFKYFRPSSKTRIGNMLKVDQSV